MIRRFLIFLAHCFGIRAGHTTDYYRRVAMLQKTIRDDWPAEMKEKISKP